MKKIIWALDIFSDTRLTIEKIAFLLQNNFLNDHVSIEPVFVLKTELLPDQEDNLQDSYLEIQNTIHSASQIAKQLFSEIKLNGLLPPRILLQETAEFGKAAGVVELVNYAQSVGSELIILNTHARKGLPRLLLGSFAESLLLSTEIPICVLNPRAKVETKFETVLFPTDFSGNNRSILASVIKLCQRFNSKLTLLHHFVEAPQILTGFNPELLYQVNDRKGVQSQSIEWVDLAKSKGVEARCVFIERNGMTSEVISEYADQSLSSAIVMAPELGLLGSAVLGSVTRKVMRSSRVPLFVFHPFNIDEHGQNSDKSSSKGEFVKLY